MKALQKTGDLSTIRAKYVVGCDGAHSATRAAIGRKLAGEATSESWGVMDVLAVTDFPDIRVKCAIYSASQGNILIIPREGGYMVRLYIELNEVSDKVLGNRGITPTKLAEVANRIMHPYKIEVKDVGWCSVYEIGQSLCDKFDDVPVEEMASRLPRVFIAGGVNREIGCMVVARPDQYVSHILPLHEHQALTAFFTKILIDTKHRAGRAPAGRERHRAGRRD